MLNIHLKKQGTSKREKSDNPGDSKEADVQRWRASASTGTIARCGCGNIARPRRGGTRRSATGILGSVTSETRAVAGTIIHVLGTC